MQETYAKLQHELSLAEEKLRKAQQQGKLVEGERKVLDNGIAKANNSIKVRNVDFNQTTIAVAKEGTS